MPKRATPSLRPKHNPWQLEMPHYGISVYEATDRATSLWHRSCHEWCFVADQQNTTSITILYRVKIREEYPSSVQLMKQLNMTHTSSNRHFPEAIILSLKDRKLTVEGKTDEMCWLSLTETWSQSTWDKLESIKRLTSDCNKYHMWSVTDCGSKTSNAEHEAHKRQWLTSALLP